jgi:phage gp29-like protein
MEAPEGDVVNLTFKRASRGFATAASRMFDVAAPTLASPAPDSVVRTPIASAPAPATQTDEIGRELVRTRHPVLGTMYTPRTKDRLSALNPPWTPEQIVDAFRQAENGDLQMQSALFEYMEERDGALGGFMQSRRLAPCGLKWSIEPADDSPEAEKVAQFVRDEIRKIPNFPIAFRHMTDAIGKAISALWIDWQAGGRTPQSKYRIDGIHHINAKRYRFHWQKEKFLILPDDKQGSDAMMPTAMGAAIGVEPLPWKVLVHISRLRSGHPARAGALRMCALYFMLRNIALKDAAVYCDVFGMPTRIAKYPDGASDEEKQALAEAMEQYGTDGIAIISKAVEIVLQESQGSGGRGMPYFDLFDACERQMELATLGQTQTNTSNKFGTRAQTEAGGAKVKQDLLEADCIDLESTLTWQLCYPIVGFSNYERPTTRFDETTGQQVPVWPVADALCPKFKLHYEPEGDYEQFIAVDVPLHGVLGLPTTLGALAKRYRRELPPGVDPKGIVRPQIPQVGAPQNDNGDADGGDAERDSQGAPPKPGERRRRQSTFASRLAEQLTFSELSRARRGQALLDEMSDRMSARSDDAMAPMEATLRTIFREAKRRGETLQDVQHRLRNAFADLDSSELEELLRRGMFTARLHGRVTAHRETEAQ